MMQRIEYINKGDKDYWSFEYIACLVTCSIGGYSPEHIDTVHSSYPLLLDKLQIFHESHLHLAANYKDTTV